MKLRLHIIILLLILVSACGEKDYVVVIKTDYGEMKAILYDETPQHKENFIKLVQEGFYDSLLFHRVMQGFMIQGGDPDSKNAEPGARLGLGGPGYTVPAEILPQFFHQKGALSAARQPDQFNPRKESSGSQFYIVQGQVYSPEQLDANAEEIKYAKVVNQLNRLFGEGKQPDLLQELITLQKAGDQENLRRRTMESIPVLEQEYGPMTFPEVTQAEREAYTTIGGTPHLDGDYTVFGRVVEGIDVIDKIASQSTDPNNRPNTDIIMTISLLELPRKEITEKYRYSYPEN